MDSRMSSTQSLFGKRHDVFVEFKKQRDQKRPKLDDIYNTLGFISSGTYGYVFKAQKRNSNQYYAIKKFKPEVQGEISFSSGMSLSACREIGLCRELKHENVVYLEDIVLDPPNRQISMVFDYCEHDLLQILHFHGKERKSIPEYTIKSFVYQILNGLSYLHSNWVLHRDLKPANILVSAEGIVKIGDLGLARLFKAPLQPLFQSDKVVVTIWYRAPELLLRSHHYTKAIDVWAVGCIFAELVLLAPLFKGEEVKMESKTTISFQKDQMSKIIDVLGYPTKERWNEVEFMPELKNIDFLKSKTSNNLRQVFSKQSDSFLKLLAKMLEYDPHQRITAEQALAAVYFVDLPKPGMNCFVYPPNRKPWFTYPKRKLSKVNE